MSKVASHALTAAMILCFLALAIGQLFGGWLGSEKEAFQDVAIICLLMAAIDHALLGDGEG